MGSDPIGNRGLTPLLARSLSPVRVGAAPSADPRRATVGRMTSGERKALLFLAGVAFLGGVARVVTSPSHAPTPADRDALTGQIAAVDSARRAAHDTTTRPPHGRRRSSDRQRRDSAHDTGSPPVQRPASPADTRIDVDAADITALVALPGIGAALARRIVADRDTCGAFGSLNALQRVRGVGPKLVERLAARVTFSGASRPSNSGLVHSP